MAAGDQSLDVGQAHTKPVCRQAGIKRACATAKAEGGTRLSWLSSLPVPKWHTQAGSYLLKSSNPITGHHKRFYTYSHQDWPLIRFVKAKKVTNQHNLKIKENGIVNTETGIPISYIWGLSLFILGMCGLWLKERLGN
ncbi:MAG: hypothetical protein HKN68_17495 [Saprospiraceae bacterium]|nr:hypothetical protein [Saprospiraceae bacterium]